MLIDSRCISDVVGVVRPEDFYLQANREIYETMYEMFSYSEVIDPVTVLDKMRARGVYNEESSAKYLMQLMEITPTAANVQALCRRSSMTRPCCAVCPRRPAASPRRCYEGDRHRRRRCWRLRKSASMPSGGAATNESLEHIGTRAC